VVSTNELLLSLCFFLTFDKMVRTTIWQFFWSSSSNFSLPINLFITRHFEHCQLIRDICLRLFSCWFCNGIFFDKFFCYAKRILSKALFQKPIIFSVVKESSTVINCPFYDELSSFFISSDVRYNGVMN
jgi:hypothetical protein